MDGWETNDVSDASAKGLWFQSRALHLSGDDMVQSMALADTAKILLVARLGMLLSNRSIDRLVCNRGLHRWFPLLVIHVGDLSGMECFALKRASN